LFELQACPCFCFPPGVVSCSVLSDPSFIVASSAILAFRLYRVIRSGCRGFTCAGVDVAADEDAGTGRGGWKDCGGTSKPLPLSILSVVATTFPPFRCKSHMILRRETCGNICCILSTSASLARMLFAEVELRFCDEDVLDEKKKYRIASAPSTSIMSSWGRFIV